jgi:hypothetical protein
MSTAIGLLIATVFQQSSIGSGEQIGGTLLAHMRRAIGHAEPGEWITYRTDGGGGRVSYWRFALVGAEKDALGREAFWVELEIGQDKTLVSPMAQMRMLIAKEGDRSPSPLTRLIVSLGADKSQEVPAAALDQLLARSHPAYPRIALASSEGPATIRTGAERRLMTSAGTVNAVPVEIRREEVLLQRLWISYQLPFLHLAKIEMPGIGYSLEVSDFGAGASSRMVLPTRSEPNSQAEIAP